MGVALGQAVLGMVADLPCDLDYTFIRSSSFYRLPVPPIQNLCIPRTRDIFRHVLKALVLSLLIFN